MCYHTIQSKLATQIERRFKAKIHDISLFSPQNHINGFTFPKTPVITSEDPEIIQHYNWGLIPHWAKSNYIRTMTLNAKIETLTEKPSFNDVVSQRCLIIADGFYEWQWQDSKGKNKIKYEIRIPNEELFAFAGLYSKWTDTQTGETVNTYTMLTTEASPLMAEIHNIKKRMPIVLHKDDELNWLAQEPLEKYAFPYSAQLVASKVNDDLNPQNRLLF